jgi:arylformamidase
MPYILSPLVKVDSNGMWGEGAAYTKRSIFEIKSGKMPPVNYDEHLIKSHSLTHVEFPSHTQVEGKRLQNYFPEYMGHFFGNATVVKLKGNKYKKIDEATFHWEVEINELKDAISKIIESSKLEKLLLTTEFCPQNENGFHDPNFVLTLGFEAATWLTNLPNFNLYGTSWKSSDYSPGSTARPIHNKLFEKAIIVENLILSTVPEDNYFLSCFPLLLADSSESPVTPILFKKNEIF